MMWDEWYDFEQPQDEPEPYEDSYVNFDFFSVLSKPKVWLLIYFFSLFFLLLRTFANWSY